jgi:predicted AAA+ superfamily ATPase
MDRSYEALLREHLKDNRQMAFLTGPRQVGKTTSARASVRKHHYFTWDRQSDRAVITKGADALSEELDLATLADKPAIVVLDEIHKYRKWKSFLKGFFDVYGNLTRIVVTGSARLGHFRRGGDSLMGRYFLYRMHPLTLAELSSSELHAVEVAPPSKPGKDSLNSLLRFGGFPEPLLRGTTRFYNRWRRHRTELLFREDLRDLTRIQEVGQVQVLAELLAARAGQLVSYSSLAAAVNASVDTIRRWISVLEGLYYCYTVRPWFRNVPKSLRKQPKVYLWDWSLVADDGSRRENLVASHLLKATHWWTDLGLGEYELCYLRDKAKREVDFLVVRNGEPWFLVEVKSSVSRRINPSLEYFASKIGAAQAFQLTFNLDYIEKDCFSATIPVRVPATTFLSQLV